MKNIMTDFKQQFGEEFNVSDRGGSCGCGKWIKDAGMCDCDDQDDTGFDPDRGGDDAYDRMREERD